MLIFKFRNKKYKLRRGPHCFVLCKLQERTKDNEEFESEHVYYTDLAGVFKYLYDEHVLDEGDYITIKEKQHRVQENFDIVRGVVDRFLDKKEKSE